MDTCPTQVMFEDGRYILSLVWDAIVSGFIERYDFKVGKFYARELRDRVIEG